MEPTLSQNVAYVVTLMNANIPAIPMQYAVFIVPCRSNSRPFAFPFD
jgi:hypothetical protein